MSLSNLEIKDWANVLDQGMLKATELDRITSKVPDLSLSEAYQIQAAGVDLRRARGEKVVGMKMGLTSQAKRTQMNLHHPIYGVLTDQMRVSGDFSLSGKIHPKIEPEIAFRTSRELSGKISRAEAFESISEVYAALEILDSRYVGFKYFSLPDVVADNSSSAFYVLSAPCTEFRGMDLANLKMTMTVNGSPAQTALSSEISGDPVISIVQLCELLHAEGRTLPEGSLVLAGAATVAVRLEKGQRVELQVDPLFSGNAVSVRII